MVIRLNKPNDSRLNCAFLMLFAVPLQNVLNAVSAFLHINIDENGLILTFMIWLYGIIITILNPIKKKNFLWLGLIYLTYILLYLFSYPLAKHYFLSFGMWIIYIYYIPLSVFLIARIDAWDNLFTEKKYLLLSDGIILISLFTKIFLNDQTEYMDYSYALLPIWGIVVVAAIYFNNNFQKIMLPIIFIQELVYGCRGALVSIVLVIIIIYLKLNYFGNCNRKTFLLKIFKACIVIGVVILGSKIAIDYFLQLDLAETSYILRRINMGLISESDARDVITQMCLDEIKRMGLNINGLFFDRLFLPSGMYSHNFILEILLSLGWIIGGLFIVWIIWNIIIQYIRQCEKNKVILICFTGTLFIRYFISGSIFSEGKFILFMAIVFSFKNVKSGLVVKP